MASDAPRKRTLLIFDTHALIHRAYHALPPLSVGHTGEPVGAVYGFASMLVKALTELRPDCVAAAFDRAGPTFRHIEFEAYKAQRPRAPDDLVRQFARVREILQAFGIPIYESDGFEADDVLGALCRQLADDVEALIVTGDADAMQLVGPQVRVLAPRKGFSDTQVFDEEAVVEKYGVRPDQITDLKGLKGDPSDNLPNVPGVGDKTAARLVQRFGSVEGVYAHLEEIEPPKLRETLREYEQTVRQNKRLATIVTLVPVSLSLDDCSLTSYDRRRVVDLFRELEFRSLVSRLADLPIKEAEPEAPARTEAAADQAAAGAAGTPPQPAIATDYRIVDNRGALADLAEALGQSGEIVVDTETTSQEAMHALLVGVSASTAAGQGVYVPVGHVPAMGAQGGLDALLRAPEDAPAQVSLAELRELLGPILADPRIPKVAHHGKYDVTVLAEQGIPLDGLAFDTMIAAHLLNEPRLGLKELALSRLGVEMTPISSLIGKGNGQISMAQTSIPEAGRYAAADADMTGRLRRLFEPELIARGLWDLFTEIEMPLVPILVDMERTGVKLDTAALREMSRELGKELLRLEEEIYRLVGHKFNVNSTAQLGKVLFEELKLPTTSSRKTQHGWSTDAVVLDELREKHLHPVVDLILEYRQLVKLKGTYVDALPALIHPRTGRVHTNYSQTAVSTGRLSSSNPNLQNIPIRTPLGRQVRRAFVASGPENVLVSCDYSQVELRILAHFSQDPLLVAAFRNDEDSHRMTAAAVYGKDPAAVTPHERDRAKRMNFAVIYGVSEYGLAQATDLSRKEAAEFINVYFQKYPGVRAYLDRTKDQVRALGYVETLKGRRRYIPEVNSSNPQVRGAAERMAMNMPIQGTNADIIKIAMIRIHDRLKREGWRSRMILQVHDELVFDVPRDELDQLATMVCKLMETAVPLSVPLKVDVKVGPNWDQMEKREIHR
ncbi:MAG: DNA polymerase I [Chloroflexi bacterium]|nr:DNA polymerase I [Chloroflexota bacterium]